jgi:hypothetical protein
MEFVDLAQATELPTTTSTYSLPAPLRVPRSKASSFNSSPGAGGLDTTKPRPVK